MLELNIITGIIIVLETMAFFNFLELFNRGITLVVSVDKLAVSLVASLISELVMPWALLLTTC